MQIFFEFIIQPLSVLSAVVPKADFPAAEEFPSEKGWA